MTVPKYDQMMNATLQALRKLGGSASISELEDSVARILDLTEEQLNENHRGSETKFSYRLAWTRNYLKRYGLLENSSRGIWALTPQAATIESVDPNKVKKDVKVLDKEMSEIKNTIDKEIEEDSLGKGNWKEDLLLIIKKLSPEAFERLCQRLLRESGFVQVEVTNRGADEGIDGKGVVKIGGILSFHVIFQAKRYKGNVGSPVIRDFRGAMIGRADKGLIITTGSFTRGAKMEAQRDGASPIDLIDGEELIERLKALSIGLDISTTIIENVKIKKDWFSSL